MKHPSRSWLLVIIFVAAFAGCAVAQTASKPSVPQRKDLVVDGKITAAAVLQMDGHSFVDVEALAQALNAGVAFESGKVILTLPPASAPSAAAAKKALSREFAQAGIAAVSDMREWRGAIASTIRFGVAAGTWLGPFLQDYQARAQKSLNQALLAAKSASDSAGSELLKNEFANLKQWDAQTQSTIQSLNGEQAVNPASSENDPLRIKVADCSAFLDSMLVSGEFQDNANCH